LWLAASADRRVSIWSADWSKDFCELVDWLTFPPPPIGLDGKAIRRGDPVCFISHLNINHSCYWGDWLFYFNAFLVLKVEVLMRRQWVL